MSHIDSLKAAFTRYNTEIERAQKSADMGPAIGLLAGAKLSAAVGLYLAVPHAETLRKAKEQAWDEGFDAGEQDAHQHKTLNEPCIPNPYRAQQ